MQVSMPDGSTYDVKTLLADGDSNTKLRKSNASQTSYLTVGLSLAPANESGYELCASRSPGCTRACLFTAGKGIYDSVRNARIAKARLFMEKREYFFGMLYTELLSWVRKATKQGKVLACRLNVVSDIQWEKVMPELFKEFSGVQFYDYTKHYRRALTFDRAAGMLFPQNYHLTFSRSEVNDEQVNYLIKHSKVNIAVVFDSKNFPRKWRGRKVINGDETDLRFLDPSGTIVALYAKGRGKKDESGFVLQTKLEVRKR